MPRRRREPERMVSREFQPTCGDLSGASSKVAGKCSQEPPKCARPSVASASVEPL